MELVGFHYKYGTNEFLEKDLSKAAEWLQKAHEAGGSVYSTEHLGHLLVVGDGIPKNNVKGVMLLSMAATKGSDWAAYMLGSILADGRYGIDVDKAEARRLLNIAVSNNDCPHKSLENSAKTRAQAKLDKLNTL